QQSPRAGARAADARPAAAPDDDAQSGRAVDRRLPVQRLHARALRSAPEHQSADRRMRLSIIAALSANNVIGRGNALPWRLSGDLKRFKTLTMGHHLLLGRRTFESIGRPLPGRTMIVLTRGTIATAGV